MKIAVFVDGANFFFMQRDSLRWFIDPRKLLAWIAKKGSIVDAHYYMAIPPDETDGQMAFRKALAHLGYSVVSKPLKTIANSDGTTRRKANLDVEIAVDMFNTVDHYDMAVLVSGDIDFERPIDLLRGRGKKVEVLSTVGFVAPEIRAKVGMHFTDFQDIRSEVEKEEKDFSDDNYGNRNEVRHRR